MLTATQPLVTLEPGEIARLLRLPPPPPDPIDRHVAAIMQGAKITDAAVLVPMVMRDGQLSLLFTQRTSHLAAHPGQISFPGGRVEATDAGREDTALRETEEEIGVARKQIQVLGTLPDYFIPTGFRITPVVGWIEAPFDTRPDPFEVADIFEVPLAHFLQVARYQRCEYQFNGRHRHYVAIPWEGRYIWGATAGMLLGLAQLFATHAAHPVA